MVIAAKMKRTIEEAMNAEIHFPTYTLDLRIGFGSVKYPVLFWNSPEMASPPKKIPERITTKVADIPHHPE